ncbi:Misato-like protein 1 [Elysia marginata]|uniref:Misato-like protein 1 n=1 Tax=Elysia marginata TaxID=1093978 RepID=A0AAV4HXK3_9GAST|nr:Misato-like protein 1 [Elysia marginata]
MLFDAKDLDSCIAELSFNMTMQPPPTHTHTHIAKCTKEWLDCYRPQQPKSPRTALSSCSTVDDVLRLYLAETYPSSLNAGCVMRDGVMVGSPFPHIFSPNINHKGFISDTQRSANSGVYSVPAMTSLQSSSNIHSYVASLQQCVAQFKISRHNHFLEAGMEEDDYQEMVENLFTLAECYKTEGG